jgi:DNA primase
LQQLLIEIGTSLPPDEPDSGRELEGEPGRQLEEQIEKSGLSAFLARLEGMVAHANLWSVRKEAAAADAAVSLRQVLSLHRKVSTLNRELHAVERRLADDPCEEDQARLADIREQLSAIDGTEAALEGFGSRSGRVSRAL